MSEENQNDSSPLADSNERLGVDYTIPGVDPHFVHPFAKATRAIGAIVVAIFLVWGLFYEWGYRGGAFYYIAKDLFGMGYPEAEVFQVLIAITIGIAGWVKRFFIGNIICVIIFGILGLLGKIFKAM